ncbi:hypothetical protein [Paenibacillus sp. FSL H8-0034]|jgi:hypothetical protein
MDVTKPDSPKSRDFKENKFIEEEAELQANKAAKRPPSLNGIPKQNNPQ